MSKNYNKIGIIGAMQIEVEALCAAMENTERETVGNMTFVYGDLRGKKVVCAKCGIGKVFAAMCAQTMILKYAPDCIINSGVAGTLSETLSIGQIALADQVVQHDMDTSALGDPVGLISGINVGYNLGDDIAYSGTIGAILEGARMGMNGIAISADVDYFLTSVGYLDKIYNWCSKNKLFEKNMLIFM